MAIVFFHRTALRLLYLCSRIRRQVSGIVTSNTLWCADKLILETILQDKFFYFKAEEGGVAVATATDDNAEIRNLDARLF